ncbi:MAG: YceD family protein [Steroidobacteraceae bacterium]|jgi:uncharacterized protein|nr:YceD family protein [Steroidobacteraceae bacterium]
MPADWSRPVDVDRLADAGETRDFDAELAVFPRLADQLARPGARARGSLSVARERRLPVVDVEVHAQLPLTCQRCLGVVEVPVDSSARVAIVPDLAAADALGSDLEPYLAVDGKLALRDLVEEQLLLSLPLVPRHEDDAQCASAGAAREDMGREGARGEPDEDAGAPVTQKPFAELGELLKRKR